MQLKARGATQQGVQLKATPQQLNSNSRQGLQLKARVATQGKGRNSTRGATKSNSTATQQQLNKGCNSRQGVQLKARGATQQGVQLKATQQQLNSNSTATQQQLNKGCNSRHGVQLKARGATQQALAAPSDPKGLHTHPVPLFVLPPSDLTPALPLPNSNVMQLNNFLQHPDHKHAPLFLNVASHYNRLRQCAVYPILMLCSSTIFCSTLTTSTHLSSSYCLPLQPNGTPYCLYPILM